MSDPTTFLEAAGVPTDRPIEVLDARELPPPEPLQKTLELLPELSPDTVVVQHNDRAPQYLYPKLSDRGWRHETTETDDGVVTVIWQETDE